MSKKISPEKLVQLAEGFKSASSVARSTPAVKGISIGEKCPREDVSEISPQQEGLKGKRGNATARGQEEGKIHDDVQRDGEQGSNTSSGSWGGHLSQTWQRLKAQSLHVGESRRGKELLEEVIPPVDKEEVKKLDLEWAISRLFCGVGEVIIFLQVIIFFCIFILLTSLISCRCWCLCLPSSGKAGN